MRTINFDLIMQKGSRVVQMIIAQKFSDHFHIQKMRAKNKSSVGSGCIFAGALR